MEKPASFGEAAPLVLTVSSSRLRSYMCILGDSGSNIASKLKSSSRGEADETD